MGAPATESDALSRIADSEVRRFLRDKWGSIVAHFEPIHFILFGSRIQGTPHAWSDIDLIVVSERFKDVPFIKRSYLFKTVVQPEIGVTALCYTPEEFQNQRAGIGVVADACREGIWLR